MQPEKPYHDDLDYLAQQGFEHVPTDDSDLEDLKRQVRTRSFSLKPGYFVLGGLIVTAALAAGLFFRPGGDAPGASAPTAIVNTVNPQQHTEVLPEQVIELNAVDVVKENFINPQAHAKKTEKKEEAAPSGITESPDVIVAMPLDLSMLNPVIVKEEKLKYMINSPVFYLHDMKITDYTTLYFKKNHFVRFSGLGAVYSATADAVPTVAELKEQHDYYLHEEIANAMLLFKKGRYDETINSLRTVASYNNDDLNCDFYLGMSYYYKKNYTKAIDFFDLCITHSNNTFLQEAMYYKALSLYEKNNKEEARILFSRIAEEGEFYAEKARTVLKEMAH